MGCPVVHFEIGCPDSEQACAFYSKLFDWKIESNGGSARVSTGSGDGIPGHITALGHEPRNYVNIYVEVDDVAAYLQRAKELGATPLVGPLDVPDGSGTFAWLKDPGGTTIALWKPAR